MRCNATLAPAGILIGLTLLSTAAICQPNGDAKTGTSNHVVVTFRDSDSKWPQLVSVGKTVNTVTWTCKASRDPKWQMSPEYRFQEDIELVDRGTVSSRTLVPATMAGIVQCETHQLELSTSGPGTLKVK